MQHILWLHCENRMIESQLVSSAYTHWLVWCRLDSLHAFVLLLKCHWRRKITLTRSLKSYDKIVVVVCSYRCETQSKENEIRDARSLQPLWHQSHCLQTVEDEQSHALRNRKDEQKNRTLRTGCALSSIKHLDNKECWRDSETFPIATPWCVFYKYFKGKNVMC